MCSKVIIAAVFIVVVGVTVEGTVEVAGVLVGAEVIVMAVSGVVVVGAVVADIEAIGAVFLEAVGPGGT